MKKALIFTRYIIVLLFVSFLIYSCGKKEEYKLESLREQLVNVGYEGSYEKAGRMEKTALGLFGVKDRMFYTSDDLNVVFIEIKPERDFDDIISKVLPIILENAGKDQKEAIKTAKENIVTKGNLMMIYHGVEMKNEQFIEVFENI